jgi:hypothetical protein
LTLIVEANQQIRNHTHCLPSEKELQEVVTHYQHQHRKGKERDVRKESVITLLTLHITNGVDMNHQRDEGHHTHHGGGQRVN